MAAPEVMPGLVRQSLHGHGMTLLRLTIRAGVELPAHSHPEEQMTIILAGELSFDFGAASQPTTAAAGDVVHIPGGIAHSATAKQDVVAIEVFAPARPELT
jgi:quercetin dioxygenase-like cupin family protein